MKSGFLQVLGLGGRALGTRTHGAIQFSRGVGIVLLLVSTVVPAAASSVVVESYLYENEEFSGSPLQERDIKDTGSNGIIEASTSASYDPIYSNQTSGEVVMLNSYAAGDLGASHLESDTSFSSASPSTVFEQYYSTGVTTITLTDLILSGPAAQVTTQINFHLEGSLQASTSVYTSGSNDVDAASGFATTITANGKPVADGSYTLQSAGGNAATSNYTDLLANFTGNNVLTTGMVTLPTNVPITLVIESSVKASVAIGSTSAGLGQSVANFQNTFSFATDRPVFDLPDFFTANSVSGGIFDNEYFGASVPEPSTWSMFLAAAVMFVVGFRRRSGRVS